MEDISGVIAAKLRLESGEFLTSSLLQGFADISFIPEITVIDICNYLPTFSQYDHSSLRYYYKMEGHTMFKDGCVLDAQGVRFQHRSDYVALKARVKPRTNEKDSLTRYNY